MQKFIALYIFILTGFALQAEGGDRQAYINKWKDVAIEQMEKHGIPASITLAQGILESGNGRSMLTREANNHFGIKCHGWKGPGVYKDDDKKNECFRKYKTARQSFEDHSQFLMKRRYAGLFELKQSDYKGWAKGLKKAGYATDPAYARRLITLIEENDLARFDDQRLAKREKFHRTAKREKVKPTSSESTEVEIDLVVSRQVEMHPNNIKFVRAKKGDDIKTIASAMDVAPWQIKKYNDMGTRTTFKEGEFVYLQPKRRNGKKAFHKAIKGETLKEISQNHGVSLKKIREYNSDIPPDKPLAAGQRILLKKPRN
jgi:hypothetical protein